MTTTTNVANAIGKFVLYGAPYSCYFGIVEKVDKSTIIFTDCIILDLHYGIIEKKRGCAHTNTEFAEVDILDDIPNKEQKISLIKDMFGKMFGCQS